MSDQRFRKNCKILISLLCFSRNFAKISKGMQYWNYKLLILDNICDSYILIHVMYPLNFLKTYGATFCIVAERSRSFAILRRSSNGVLSLVLWIISEAAYLFSCFNGLYLTRCEGGVFVSSFSKFPLFLLPFIFIKHFSVFCCPISLGSFL